MTNPIRHLAARRILLTILMGAGVALYTPSGLAAQDVPTASPAQLELVRAELTKRGLTEQEARAALVKEGIVIEAIPLAELPAYKDRIVAVLDRLVASKRAAVTASVPTVPGAAAPTAAVVTGSDAASPTTTVAEAVSDAKERVAAQAGEPPGIYGHDIFINKTLDVFRTTDGARAPESYILGGGDRIRVSIFGTSQADLLLEVSSEGFIQADGVPKIFVQGLTLAQARPLVQSRLASYYRFNSDQFALTIQTARTVTVNIFGESKINGSFSLSALNTAFNALAAAGGPTGIGSVRDIQVIRGNSRRRMDVYAFMNDPRVLFDFDLQHNDVLFVPLARTVVSIEGAVKRPMRYELVEKEELADLIRFAGGINFNTNPDYVQVQRVEGDSVVLKEWRLRDVLSGAVRVALRDGDVARVRAIGRPLEQFVDVTGSVFYEGRYDLGRNPSVQDVLVRAQLKPQAKTDLLFIERVQLDGSVKVIPLAWDDSVRAKAKVMLEPRDRLLVFDKERYADVATLSVEGAVRNPVTRTLGYGDRIPLRDVITLAGGLQPTAADVGFVIRTDLFNPKKVDYLRVDVRKDVHFPLGAGDKLMVYDRRTYTDVGELSLGGAVKNAVRTEFNQTLTIADLLTMGGGFTRAASLQRVDVFRLNVSSVKGATFDRIAVQLDSAYRVVSAPAGFRLQPFDQVVVREIPLYDVSRTVQVDGQVMYPGTYALKNHLIHLSDVIAEAGGLNELADPKYATLVRTAGGVGPVGIDLSHALQRKHHLSFDPILLEGDVITIPRRSNLVAIRLRATRLGELATSGVVNGGITEGGTTSFSYEGDRAANWYIHQFAGGFAQKADKWSVTVTDPNGKVTGTKRRLLFFKDFPTAHPGSTISLRYKFEVPPEEKKKIDYDAIYTRTFQVLTTVLSLIVLSRQL
ncbi:MAG: polysaccharide biosynthesis/export family protein [Gemmatimonadaceae bacterium]